jgi:hypothetical protein
MSKLSERLRGASGFDPLGIETTCERAADALDECERVLQAYVLDLCELGQGNVGCGKYDADTCGGCRAQSVLSKLEVT